MSNLSPNVLNYHVGRGDVYFDRFDSDGNSTGEMHLGNAPSFGATPATENLDHYSSMESAKKKDASINISNDFTIPFTLDEYSTQNINLAFWGDNDISTESQGDGNYNNVSFTAREDKYVKVTDKREWVSGSVVVTDSTGITTYTENTDYVVDYDIGRIKCLSTGSITDEDSLLVDFSWQAASWSVINPAGNPTIEGLLRFRGKQTGGDRPHYEFVFWKVKLSITGTIPIISEEWGTMEFEAEVLSDDANHPDNPYGKIYSLGDEAVIES